MHYFLGIIYILTIISGIICIFILATRGERGLKTNLFLGSLASGLLWCISQMGIFMAANDLQLSMSYVIGNIGICYIGAFWLNFILCFIGKINKKFMSVCFGISTILFLGMITNPLHHMYYAVLDMNTKEYVWLFFVNIYYVYLCNISGSVLLLRSKVKSKHHMACKKMVLVIGMMPLLFNLLQHMKIINVDMELTPLSFSVTNILIFLAIFKYDFLNIKKLAFEEIIQDVNEGIIVFTSLGEFSYMNQSAKKYLSHINDIEELYQTFDTTDLSALKNKEEVIAVKDDKHIQIQKIITSNKIDKLVSISFILKDVSKFYQLMEQNAQISQLEQELLIEQERNDIIQKVHDTLGHTLTMIQSLIKLGMHSYEERKEAEGYFIQAKNLAADSIRELREYINETKKCNTNESISCCISSLVDTIKEIPIELSIAGYDEKKYMHHKDIIYLCIKELITNCLKYAHASKMQIIIKYLDNSVEIFVFDDGVGCDKIVYGNGLLGMKERIVKARGEFRVNSAKDGGFQTFIFLPI